LIFNTRLYIDGFLLQQLPCNGTTLDKKVWIFRIDLAILRFVFGVNFGFEFRKSLIKLVIWGTTRKTTQSLVLKSNANISSALLTLILSLRSMVGEPGLEFLKERSQ
jgi:hypothetical protein